LAAVKLATHAIMYWKESSRSQGGGGSANDIHDKSSIHFIVSEGKMSRLGSDGEPTKK